MLIFSLTGCLINSFYYQTVRSVCTHLPDVLCSCLLHFQIVMMFQFSTLAQLPTLWSSCPCLFFCSSGLLTGPLGKAFQKVLPPVSHGRPLLVWRPYSSNVISSMSPLTCVWNFSYLCLSMPHLLVSTPILFLLITLIFMWMILFISSCLYFPSSPSREYCRWECVFLGYFCISGNFSLPQTTRRSQQIFVNGVIDYVELREYFKKNPWLMWSLDFHPITYLRWQPYLQPIM